MKDSILMIYENLQDIMNGGGSKLYLNHLTNVESNRQGISNIFTIFSGAFSTLAILSFFYFLTLPKIENKLLFFLLLFCAIIGIFSGISSGSRGGAYDSVIIFVANYFFFKDLYTDKIKRVFKTIGLAVIVVIAIPIVYITTSRFDNATYGVSSSINYYFGQYAFIFNKYAFDDGGIRYGDRTAPLFKKMIGFYDVPNNFFERRSKYQNLKVNDEVGISYVGDILIDYGPIVGTLLMLLVTILFVKGTKARNGKLRFHQLILYEMIIVCIAPSIHSLYPFSDTGGNLKIIVCFTTYIILKFNESNIHVTHNYM
jgi:oligosaccharide repeat unit polymerase